MVSADQADFDANYDSMLDELEKTGMSDAEAMLTDIIAEQVALTNS